LFFGAAGIAAVSSILFTVGFMNSYVPMPVHIIILAWILSYGFIVVMPLIYLVEFKLLSNRKDFGKNIIIATLLFSVLSVYSNQTVAQA